MIAETEKENGDQDSVGVLGAMDELNLSRDR